MEQNFQIQPVTLVGGPDKKKRFLKSTVVLATVFLLAGGGIYAWRNWLSPAAVEKWKFELYQKYYVDKYENASLGRENSGRDPTAVY
ncbi:MAG: hypothetical protein UW85_C0002G0003 [Parcubacteria group bacterium GW2011_GWA1_Parcubacteria_45_10]|nr:MAG: hypothetical protein UW85_C0002G0003 [Parcubacteria group bacterium GW2011_GWA1_Parcubacteria_45_10]